MYYTTLNDAATITDILSKGSVKVYYKAYEYTTAGTGAVQEIISQSCTRGVKALRGHFGEYAAEFVKVYLEQTHVCLGEIKGSDNVDDIAYVLQGEVWSPEGEARNIIRSKNLSHTSMSIGDIVEMPNGDLFLFDIGGMAKL